ncbi:MAG: hypothetical protein JST08_00040 [Actinobacteria bacterium]|nr:hypothetical protein [Actinomycetota bacterium]
MPASLRPAITAFAILLLASLLVGAIQGSRPFYFDSGNYWALSESFNNHGSFSLLHFEYTGLRGYALPLTFYLLREVGGLFGLGPGGEVIGMNAVLFALLTGVAAPALAAVAWPERTWGLLPRLALGGLFLVFWSGYLSYPLSDFPALIGAVIALVAISRVRSPLCLGIAGLAAAYAVNARPAYFLLIPMLALILAWTWWRTPAERPAGPLRMALCVGAFALGLLVVSLPQSIGDHHAGGGFSPLPGGSELAGLQYTEGLRLQRYETYVGGPDPRMEYRDPSTDGIIASLDGEAVKDTPQYLEIIVSNPVTMAGVFLRHVVNGLDERYTTPYVEHLEPPGRGLFRLAGFLLIFLAAFRLLWPRGRRSLGTVRWRYVVALLACCATVPADAVETRFLLPAFLLSALLVLTPGWPNPLESEATGLRRFRTLGIAAVACAAYLIVVGLIISAATDHLVLT